MTDDAQLLRQYVESRSQAAFAELVQRHLALVYHSAVRQLGDDAHLAEDVAQSVFMLLARKSPVLLAHPSLAAWLHSTTHFKVSELLRTERRRRAREAAAHFMHELMQNELSAQDWERLRPMVDEVLLELKESDREAVLLRFFQDRPFAEIAALLRLSEKTAQKRIERALENLRERLRRRGVKSTAAALAAVLGSHAALAGPPTGLAASVTGAVVSSGLPAAATWSVVTFMSTKTTATIAAVALVVAGGFATHEMNASRDMTARMTTIEQENGALAAQLSAELSRRTNEAVKPRAAPAAAAPAQTSSVARALGSGGLASVEESQAFLEANPDVRDALAASVRASLGAQYAELFTTLGLTDDEREKFLAIWSLGMRRIVGEHQFGLGDTMTSGAEITRQLRELLGEDRYQQYREFGRSGAQRDVARELTRSLYFTPAPLTPAQATDLKQIVARAINDPAVGTKNTASAWPYIPLPVWDRILMEARVVLAEPQLDALRELQQRSQFFHAQGEASKAWRAKQAAAKEAGK